MNMLAKLAVPKRVLLKRALTGSTAQAALAPSDDALEIEAPTPPPAGSLVDRAMGSERPARAQVLQQLLDQVTVGNRELQKTLTDLLQQLAMEPRTSNVNVQDSVVMKSGPEISHQQSSGKPHIPTIQAIPIGKPQHTTEVEWMKSLPKDLT